MNSARHPRNFCCPAIRSMTDTSEPDLTYKDEYRIARYLVAKHGNTSPAWLARTMGVQWPQAARWLEAMDRKQPA
jgi:hypothetical protein